MTTPGDIMQIESKIEVPEIEDDPTSKKIKDFYLFYSESQRLFLKEINGFLPLIEDEETLVGVLQHVMERNTDMLDNIIDKHKLQSYFEEHNIVGYEDDDEMEEEEDEDEEDPEIKELSISGSELKPVVTLSPSYNGAWPFAKEEDIPERERDRPSRPSRSRNRFCEYCERCIDDRPPSHTLCYPCYRQGY